MLVVSLNLSEYSELTSQTSFLDFGRPIIGFTELDDSLEINQSDMLDDNLPFPLFIL